MTTNIRFKNKKISPHIMSGSYKSLLTKFAQLQTFVSKNAVTLTGDNLFTGDVEFVQPLNINDLIVLGQTT